MSGLNITLIMFGGLLAIMMTGMPIAFATALIGLISAYFLWGQSSVFLLSTSVSATMNNWVLVAVPLFVFMAMLLDKFGVVNDLYKAMHKWSGGMPGGLAVATVLVGTIMGAMTGVAAGVVVALGLIALPQMLSFKYDKYIAMGTVMVAGCLSQLIPPSVAMIVYGSLTQNSVGALFASGISVGLLFSAIYIGYILVRGYSDKKLLPPLPLEERATWREKFASLKSLYLPALLVLFVLGAIFSGTATPTEGSAVGCLGAILCGLVLRRLKWSIIHHSVIETIKVSAMCMWIAIGAKTFGAVFDGIGGHALVAQLATTLVLGKWGVFVLIHLILFIMGCFLDQIAIMFITAPMFSIAAVSVGFDPLWFGMTYLLNMFMGFLTPPFGYALFYVKGVAPPSITMGEIYKAALPFVAMQAFGLLLCVIFPEIVLWLPRLLIG